MLNLIQKLSLLFLFSLTLQAHSGLSQEHLVSLSPDNTAQGIAADTSIEIEYDLTISKDSISKNTLVLKNSNDQKIKGKTRVKNNKTLIFTPSAELHSGVYKVKVKKLNLQDYTANTRFKRYAKKVCSYFYDDVKQCRLYNYATRVKSKKIKYTFSVDDNKPKIISLTLNKSNIQLNEDNTTTISVNAKYDNNETIDVTNEVEWITSNSNIVKIDKNIITPLSEGTTTLQAKLNTQTTQEISLTVYKEINGYKLPPEPDETLNNSTLLGIDVNDNGVRDDVERYVIKRYAKDPEFPKTKTALAMQYAWSTQKILDNPVIESKQYSDDAIDCQYYWINNKRKDMSTLDGIKYSQKHKVFNDSDTKDKIYNTRERIEQKFFYNSVLSGNIFDGRKQNLENCQINIDELEE